MYPNISEISKNVGGLYELRVLRTSIPMLFHGRTCGVELHEFQVLHWKTGTRRHGASITCRGLWHQLKAWGAKKNHVVGWQCYVELALRILPVVEKEVQHCYSS